MNIINIKIYTNTVPNGNQYYTIPNLRKAGNK